MPPRNTVSASLFSLPIERQEEMRRGASSVSRYKKEGNAGNARLSASWWGSKDRGSLLLGLNQELQLNGGSWTTTGQFASPRDRYRTAGALPLTTAAPSPAAPLLRRLAQSYGLLRRHWSAGRCAAADAGRGLHFAAITDHGEYFDRDPAFHTTHQWATVAEQTVACSRAAFVAIRGFEWSSPRQGHSNV